MSSTLGEDRPLVLVVAGPTASGKSALALCLAEALGGEIVNADSMQLYRELHVLTARPSPADETRVPHRLYGVLPAACPASAAWWRDRALQQIRAIAASRSLPILCGGTGLYLRALMQGIADIPKVPPSVLEAARRRHAAIGGPGIHAELASVDPDTAARLAPGDTQRLLRAWSVHAATGRPLSAYHAAGAGTAAPLRFLRLLVDPPRQQQIEAIGRRFDAMIEAGALDEVRALAALDLPPHLPAMKALGVPQLLAAERGVLPLAQAVEDAKTATRRYAKRQRTWFRHQFLSDYTIQEQFSESHFAKIFPEIRDVVLTAGV